jgi:two-component system, cell cycle sensor histidine kinase and response regulator CckA
VLLNLTVNARDALPNGGRLTIATRRVDSAEIKARLGAHAPQGEYVLLTVEDTGTGMTEEVRSQVFEPFFTTKQVGKGTGIGLSTVYGIVHKYSGAIWVTSELGFGTVFYLAFPVAGEGAWRPVIRRSGPPASAAGKTILLVEDDHQVRRVSARILREEGYVVLEASNAAEAAAVSENHTVDLLLTDVVMSGLSGIELAEQLTKRFPRLLTLIMSGYPGDRVEGLRVVDENSYLEKPLTRKKLLAHVSRVLLPSSN